MNLGIDFGTCYSSVANCIDGRTFILIGSDLDKGEASLFAYNYDEDIKRFGNECFRGPDKYQFFHYMKTAFRENPNGETILDGAEFCYEEIVEGYLSYLINKAKSISIDKEFETVTITAPIAIKDGYITATDYNSFLQETVMDITGLPEEKVHVINEPVAAALSYFDYQKTVYKKKIESSTVLVFDLGGGTLDITVVEFNFKKNKYDVIDKGGLADLGGNNWDDIIFDELNKMGNVSTKEERLDDIIILKHQLSFKDSYPISIDTDSNGGGKRIYYTRQSFEEASKVLLDRAMTELDRVVSNVKNAGNSIGAVVMVGGACNMPQIKDAIVKKNICDDVFLHAPSGAICRGAAVYTNMIGSVSDIAQCSYGILSYDERKEKDVIYNLIKKGTYFKKGKICTNIPKKENHINKFYPNKITDENMDENKVIFDIYENDCYETRLEEEVGSNSISYEVTIPDTYQGKREAFPIYVQFALSKDGIFTPEFSTDIFEDEKINKLGCKEIKKNQ
ncbi:MAG: Hsp70 family protein [Christensenellales bacterium]